MFKKHGAYAIAPAYVAKFKTSVIDIEDSRIRCITAVIHAKDVCTVLNMQMNLGWHIRQFITYIIRPIIGHQQPIIYNKQPRIRHYGDFTYLIVTRLYIFLNVFHYLIKRSSTESYNHQFQKKSTLPSISHY